MHTRAPQQIQPPPPRKDEVLTIRLDADLAASVKALVAANGGNLSHHLRQLMQGAVAGYDPRKEEQRAISLLSAAGYGIARPGLSSRAPRAEAKTYDKPAERRAALADTCELAADCSDDELVAAVQAINAQTAAAGEEPAEDESEREELERLRRDRAKEEDALEDFERAHAAAIKDPAARARFVRGRLARKAKRSK